ncbi:MAG: ACT domain-containing protein [Cetobacterium sp.]
MKSIITVLGKDQVGIIARISTYLAEVNVNILDISQTIIAGYFNMIMIVDVSDIKKPIEIITEDLSRIGGQLGVVANIQNEDIFNCMHRI